MLVRPLPTQPQPLPGAVAQPGRWQLSVQPVRPLWWGGGLGIPVGPCCRCPVCPGGEGLLPGSWLSQLHHGLGVRLRACSPAPPTSPMLSLDSTLQSLWNQNGRDGGLASSNTGRATARAPTLQGRGWASRAGSGALARGWPAGRRRGRGGAAQGAPSRSRFPREPAASTSLSPPPGAALLGRIRRQRGDGPLREDSRASVGLSGPIRKCTAFLWPRPPSVPAAHQSCHTLNRVAQADRCPARCPRRTPR